MRSGLRLTLLADGRSDKCLLVLLRWMVGTIVRNVNFTDAFADLGVLSDPPKKLSDKVRKAVELYPCDVLFVHRDAEAEPAEKRIEEVRRAVEEAAAHSRWVPVVPVRMTEAWLLVDEAAIRQAASNPSGTAALDLPALSRLEGIRSPKTVLHRALEKASGRSGRRLDQFRRDMGHHVHRVAQLIQNKESLREIAAFKRLEADTRDALRGLPGMPMK